MGNRGVLRHKKKAARTRLTVKVGNGIHSIFSLPWAEQQLLFSSEKSFEIYLRVHVTRAVHAIEKVIPYNLNKLPTKIDLTEHLVCPLTSLIFWSTHYETETKDRLLQQQFFLRRPTGFAQIKDAIINCRPNSPPGYIILSCASCGVYKVVLLAT